MRSRLPMGPIKAFNFYPLAIVASIVFAVCVVLNYTTYSREQLDFTCNAKVIEANNFSQKLRELSLRVKSFGRDVQMSYSYNDGINPPSLVVVNGRLLDFEVSTMTYSVMFTGIDEQLSQNIAPISPELQIILEAGRSALEDSEQVEQQIQVLDMDSDKGYAVLKFRRANNIWACKIGGQ